MNKEKAMRRIKQCLALSESNNSHEAITALRQAHKLMAQYDVDKTDIDLAEVNFINTDFKLPKTLYSYHWMLANMIADLFGCEYYQSTSNNKSVMVFVGVDIHANVASYAFDVLMMQLKQARLEYLKVKLNRVRLRKNKSARADMFCLGWVKQVKDLVSMLAPKQTDRDVLSLAIEQKVGELAIGKSLDNTKNNKAISINDFSNGLIKGKQAQLFQGVSGNAASYVLPVTHSIAYRG